jgi:hypothetical protein
VNVAHGLGVGWEQRCEPSVDCEPRDQHDTAGRKEPTQHEDSSRVSGGKCAEGRREGSETITTAPLPLPLREGASVERSTWRLMVAHDIDCFRHHPQLPCHSMVTDWEFAARVQAANSDARDERSANRCFGTSARNRKPPSTRAPCLSPTLLALAMSEARIALVPCFAGRIAL